MFSRFKFLSRVALRAHNFRPINLIPKRTFQTTSFKFNNSLIVEIDEENFEKEFLQSRIPIIVDLYADWCVPCKTLTPLLEKIVTAKKSVKLVKVNVDKHPEIAQQFQVESVPTVFGLIGTQVIVKHVGAMTESEIEKLIAKLDGEMQPLEPTSSGKSPAEDLLQQAQQAFVAQKFDDANEIYQYMIQNEDMTDHHLKAYAGVAMCLMTKGDLDSAIQISKVLKEKFPEWNKDAETKVVINMVEINQIAGTSLRPMEVLLQAVSKNDNDLQARFELSCQYFLNAPGIESKKKAIEELLTIIRKNKKWNDGKARELIKKYFEVIGEGELIKKYRQRLASLIF
jgi:putative thioredoxin